MCVFGGRGHPKPLHFLWMATWRTSAVPLLGEGAQSHLPLSGRLGTDAWWVRAGDRSLDPSVTGLRQKRTSTRARNIREAFTFTGTVRSASDKKHKWPLRVWSALTAFLCLVLTARALSQVFYRTTFLSRTLRQESFCVTQFSAHLKVCSCKHQNTTFIWYGHLWKPSYMLLA